ncbi:MAG: ABC transporter ATP-binding protein [Saprospiraceae bacterium]|nr:ABC transporter ATP-binding protein [Saprospiraceae bacterium]
MHIQLEGVGKRFRYDWIFKNISTTFDNSKRYALLGSNGSGKSTLMKILSGHLSPSTGKIQFFINEKAQDEDDIYKHISYAAPYIDLIEELTLTEMIQFHTTFKPLSKSLKINDLIEILGFEKSRHKEIRYFSSGMKQRLKLALAICSNSPILLLDEPTTNLDAQGVAWYRQLMSRFTEGTHRLTIVASNIEHDYDFCDIQLNIEDYKKN